MQNLQQFTDSEASRIYLLIQTELQLINTSLRIATEQEKEIKEDIKNIYGKLSEHHDKIMIMTTGSNIFWTKVWPNMGWLIMGAMGLTHLHKLIGF